MQLLNQNTLKHCFTTHILPEHAIHGLIPVHRPPQIGDLIVGEVLSLGKHNAIEDRSGARIQIFPGDKLVCAFGNRYATDQYEGYVPGQTVEECDLLSIGGVCGEVVSQHRAMSVPTRLRILGAAGDQHGQPLNMRTFGLAPCHNYNQNHCKVIVVVGSAMNSGKTTTVGTLVRALSQTGMQVAATKVTGTAASKDGRFFRSCGARTVLDFTDMGYPSTYLLQSGELLSTYHALLNHLGHTNPDWIVVEIADGIFQRETQMLLKSPLFHATADHVFFAANDSLSAECGVRYLQRDQLPLRAVSGAVTQSPLACREAEAATGVPCLSMDQIMEGALQGVLSVARPGAVHQAIPALLVA